MKAAPKIDLKRIKRIESSYAQEVGNDIVFSDAQVVAELQDYAKKISLVEMKEKAGLDYCMWLPVYNNCMLDSLSNILAKYNDYQTISRSDFYECQKKADIASEYPSSICDIAIIEKKLTKLNEDLDAAFKELNTRKEPADKKVLREQQELAATRDAIGILLNPESHKTFAASANKYIALNKHQIEFFRNFYKEITSLYKASEGCNDISSKVSIDIKGVNKSEYGYFFDFLKQSRNEMGLIPKGNKFDEKNVMDFTRDGKGATITIEFKNLDRAKLEPNYSVAMDVNSNLRKQQAQVIGR